MAYGQKAPLKKYRNSYNETFLYLSKSKEYI